MSLLNIEKQKEYIVAYLKVTEEGLAVVEVIEVSPSDSESNNPPYDNQPEESVVSGTEILSSALYLHQLIKPLQFCNTKGISLC